MFRAEGLRPVLARSADVRYRGQGFELRVDWGAEAVARFHALHAKAYGYADPARTVEIVTLLVQAVVRSERVAVKAKPIRRGDGARARLASHRAFDGGRWRAASLYDRSRMVSGDRIAGPSVVAELSSTTYLPPGWSATVDGSDNLVLTPRAGGRR